MSEENNKPVLDEQTLGKLLEAAYVLQEHNREMQQLEMCLDLKREEIEAQDRAAKPEAASDQTRPGKTPSPAPEPADYTLTLAKIVETQHQIQLRHLDLQSAMSLVAERVAQMAHAEGAAIGLINGKNLSYRAISGDKTLPAGAEVPVEKALCDPCIKTSQAFRCPDVNPEFLVDANECRSRGIQSLIAVPVFHDGGVAGALELYYSAANGFSEQDVHTCQLMAGLVTEALVRDEELTWKKSLASERAAMLEALEKLQPNLAALVGQVNITPAGSKHEPPPRPVESAHDPVCRKCGNKLVGEEMFCGQCGTPRSSDYEPPSMQSKLATMWEMQEAQKKDTPAGTDPFSGLAAETESDDLDGKSFAQVLEEQLPDLFRDSELPSNGNGNLHGTSSSAGLDGISLPSAFQGLEVEGLEEEEQENTQAASPVQEEAAGTSTEEDEEVVEGDSTTALAPKPTKPADWSSAASAREFLEDLAGPKRNALVYFWNTRRGDIYLAIAIILVLAVIRWGIWSDHSANATTAPTAAASHRQSATAGLSLFDRMLIQLGLAEAPPALEDAGNPAVQVWVDQRTGLYYCPGADLYGKTPKGKFTTQRDAQLDQFESAYRKPCD
ncbi:MAG TPA: GAF domain-containing protein [Candidatus Sulfotelmatobacter sp.]|nr:GAF domain-containing protein [Candidatus Sulfotelmatobacter sp.]